MVPVRIVPLTVAFAAVLFAAGAGAQPSHSAGDARGAFEHGVLLAQHDRWSEALEAFQRSRQLMDRPRTAFNAAYALQRLGRYRQANAVLAECLGMPSVTAESDLIVDAHTLQDQVRASLATLELAVAPAESEVRADGSLLPGSGTLRTLSIDPGMQTIEVTAEGMAPQRFELSAHPGEHLVRRVDLAVVPGRIHVRVDRNDATVSVDDEVVGHGTTAWQGNPGTHRIRVEAEGFRTYRRPVLVTAGRDVEMEVTLQPARAPWYASPVLWSVVAATVGGGILAAVLIQHSAGPDGGTTGQVFQGVHVP